MKKFIGIVLTLMLTASIYACGTGGGNNDSSLTNSSSTEQSVSEQISIVNSSQTVTSQQSSETESSQTVSSESVESSITQSVTESSSLSQPIQSSSLEDVSSSASSSSSSSVITSSSSSASSSSSENNTQTTVSVTGIVISGYKTDFNNAEEFSVGSLVVDATMSNNTTKTLSSTEYTVDSSAYNKLVAGTYTITVTYGSFNSTYDVTVGQPYATGITISGYKTDFNNAEEFSVGSLVVDATMSNNTTKTLSSTEYTVDSSAYNKLVAGTYTITVTYGSFNSTYDVTVGQPYATGITISGYTTTFTYGQTFSIGSLVVTANMSDGSSTTITAGNYQVDSTAYDAYTAGEYQIDVTYSSFTSSYKVTVEEGVVSSIALSGQQTEFAFAEDFATTGLKVVATYVGGATKQLSASEYTVDSSAYNFMTADSYTITVTANGTTVKSTYNATVAVADKLKVLMIGNSFADDTIAHSYEVATSLGIDPSNIIIADLYIGGCTLNTHWTNASNNTAAYRFGLEREGWSDTTSYTEWTIEQGIKYAKWDFITFQQGSGSSGLADTYTHLQELMNYVYGIATDTANNPNANPNVKFVWHQTWAYAADSTNSGWNSYDDADGNKDQLTMYNLIVDCVKSEVLTKPEFVALIPNGTAVQNARTSYLGDNLTRDQYDHLTYSVGRYMTALNMVSILTGRDFSDISWTPGTEYDGGVYGELKDIAIESVKNAQAYPLQVTNSNYVDIDVSSLYSFDWQPVGSAYWDSSSETYNTLTTTASNSANFVASAVRFIQDQIPVGSVIKLADGYQVRPEAWASDAVQTSRPANLAMRYIQVTEEFWDGYLYRAFNVSKIDGTTILDCLDEAFNALEIYVPYQTTETDAYYDTDKTILPTIDNYTRSYWTPTNGYYNSATGTLDAIITTTDSYAIKYIVPQLFTKETLPIGSIIITDVGYRYRTIGVTDNGDGTVTSVRGALTTVNDTTGTNVIVITEDWWGEYAYLSFNVGPNSGDAYTDPYGTAEHFRIYTPNNYQTNSITSLDWQPVANAYWNSGGATFDTMWTTDTFAPRYVSSSVMFTKEDLPVGSIITIESGWGYRPDGWNENKERNGNSGTSGLTRPSNVTTSFVVVTEDWWGDFTYRAFNVYLIGNTTDLTEEQITTAKTALKIYVPQFNGEGTAENPYIIKTVEDMVTLSNLSYGKNYGAGLYYKLDDDIDLSSLNWQPICFNGKTSGWPSVWYYFEGTFDGNGKIITINIDSDDNTFGMGLFAGISGTVKNLTINGSVVVTGYSGALAGRVYNGAYIEGVTNNATVTGSGNQIGGLIGNASNSAVVTFKDCINNGVVTGKSFVGGILGGAYAAVSYVNCDNTGNITATNGLAGGITGETYTSKWTDSGLDADCSNTGTISGTTTAEGLIGQIK